MPIVNGREYRTFNAEVFRAIEPAEEDNGSMVVEGYATTFDSPYEFGYNDSFECIDRHALDGADMSDVIFQYNHTGEVLARQRNNTLSVMCDDHGLFVRADLSKSQKGRELYEAIKNKLVDRMSWGFIIAEDGWEWDNKTRTSTITKVLKVFDVSAVSIPANQDTEIKARSYIDGVIEREQQELLQREGAERRKLLAAAYSLSIRE